MPSVRPCVRPSVTTRARFALPVLVAAIVVFALVGYEPHVSSACPVIMPKPLRTLYEGSGLVAVVRVGESVATEDESDGGGRRTALRLDSILKGESKEKVVQLFHYVDPDSNAQPAFKKGDVLLVFLNPRENGGYLTADYPRGLKKLSPDELKVYLRRIEELSVILRAEKPDAVALTEWLVRCAEEPATRWEGAFELSQRASLPPDPQEAQDAEDAARAEAEPDAAAAEEAAEEPDEAPVEQAAGRAENNNPTDPDFIVDVVASDVIRRELIDFAAFLTPVQKERLTLALLNSDGLKVDGDESLLLLVGSWKEPRLVPFSLKVLALMADRPTYEAEDLMRIVAHSLGDQTLVKFVANYSKTASYEDLYDEDYEEEEKSAASAEDRAAFKIEAERHRTAAAEALFQRSGKLRHFLALADQPQKP